MTTAVPVGRGRGFVGASRNEGPRWRGLVVAIAVLTALAGEQPARAFGTISAFGQRSEHRRITMLALQPFGVGPATMRQLAGHGGFSFGAVGAADNPFRGLLSRKSAHCDGGDYLDVPGYRHTREDAQHQLETCRDWILLQLRTAVADASDLALPADPKPGEGRPLACHFDGRRRGEPKCKVLEDLGLAFHAAQDFYAHTNWVDQPASQPISPANPPGLANDGPAEWLDPRSTTAFPAGLISGCYDGFPEAFHCGHGTSHARVAHHDLNKDTGDIDVDTGAVGVGTTRRGRVNGNFQRAVKAAVADTRAKWEYFQAELIRTYGPDAGRSVICRLAADDPATCDRN